MTDHAAAISPSEAHASVEAVYDAIAGLLTTLGQSGLSSFGTLVQQVTAKARENFLRSASYPWLLLPLIVGEELGANRSVSVQIAAGFELARIAAGVLDQCVDGDTDGALWTKVGMGQAVTVASGLTSLSLLAVDGLPRHSVPPEAVARVRRAFDLTWLRMCEGQQAELSLAEQNELSEDAYWAIAGAKSGAFFELGSAAVALAAEGEDSPTVQALRDLGHQAGLMVQAANDLQGLWALNSKHDVGKRLTLPIIHARATLDGVERSELNHLLALAPDDATAADRCRAIIEQSGAVPYTLMQIQIAHDRAVRCLSTLPSRLRLVALLDAWSPITREASVSHDAARS